jgi:hypothetical protein
VTKWYSYRLKIRHIQNGTYSKWYININNIMGILVMEIINMKGIIESLVNKIISENTMDITKIGAIYM